MYELAMFTQFLRTWHRFLREWKQRPKEREEVMRSQRARFHHCWGVYKHPDIIATHVKTSLRTMFCYRADLVMSPGLLLYNQMQEVNYKFYFWLPGVQKRLRMALLEGMVSEHPRTWHHWLSSGTRLHALLNAGSVLTTKSSRKRK